MIPWTMASDPMKRLRGSPSFYGVVAALLLVVFVAAALFFARAIRVEKQEHLAQNDAIARSVAASIEAREHGYLNVLRSYAGRFRFRESIKRRDRTEAPPESSAWWCRSRRSSCVPGSTGSFRAVSSGLATVWRPGRR